MHVINELILYHFSGRILGKLLCLYLVLLLLVITMLLYSWLSGMNTKTAYLWREIIVGLFCLFYSAGLFHFCNYAHNFANIVRYQRTLYEHIYIVLFVYGTV